MKKNSKIFLYGGKSTAYLVQEILLERKKKTSYIFDKYLEEIHFETKAKFSNRKEDLINFLNDSEYFFICIGMVDGKLRDILSKKIIKKKLKPISIISKDACICKSGFYFNSLCTACPTGAHCKQPNTTIQTLLFSKMKINTLLTAH